ncbi:MAG: tRNA (adenosine(37)-N6)-threonylcarbamoyltransferase complex transferase subunit TsaD [Ardenticatenales bacterium]|nr:tRNA (adenosine(37)-N6)-threonylcarbamoyltransferase complex transferase subunit TsaD [Ardenticatenales bacterium]
MRILGIETSCDETAASVVVDGREILSNIVASQIDLHARYGGIFPEVASRAHIETIFPVIQDAMSTAHLGWDDLDAIAVTRGPGLAGSLLVGVNTAKGLALGRALPLLGINHLEAHIYAAWLSETDFTLEFPMLALIVSGGHTELVLMTDHGSYQYLGGTIDDAAGEAFDKVGRLLGLPYPGGPSIEEAAQRGDPAAYRFPRAWLDAPHQHDFSFSGLKTAVIRQVQRLEKETDTLPVPDLAASFQAAVVEVLATKTARAAAAFGVTSTILAGGVSANLALRKAVTSAVNGPVHTPPIALCTDNAAMVAACGYWRLQSGQRDGWDMDVAPGLPLA